ncbi:DgyrCDS13879 [Dimorphilus gyrociliatus]|uniref:DgyrCDS13879 n=1 Tax=Dimorphilus gyrociliatus TaxID=2664684 RepID=A0A7I8WBY2_9ANNE|nr:DgyrCDS13879 [Dimorphilus gyrociliatus]
MPTPNILKHYPIRFLSVIDKMASNFKVKQAFDYFLVLDFEATCDDKVSIQPQEIIEFPCIKVNAQTFESEKVFHRYVKPVYRPQLTPFCTELTGIIQDMVENENNFIEVFKDFDIWMKEELLEKEKSFAFVTCGDWDLKTMLPSQCRTSNCNKPNYFNSWINIKRSFSDVTGTWPRGMIPMLRQLKLKHEGRHHSGIDDCRNIANILKGLGQRGYIYRLTRH